MGARRVRGDVLTEIGESDIASRDSSESDESKACLAVKFNTVTLLIGGRIVILMSLKKCFDLF